MSGLAQNADGTYLYSALESSTGQQFVARVPTATPTALWEIVYPLATGKAGNVLNFPQNPDLMLFYGHWGDGNQVFRHTVSTKANENITPSGLAVGEVVSQATINPSNPLELMISVEINQEILYTLNGGSTWLSLTDEAGTVTALTTLWSSQLYPHRLFAGGVDPNPILSYSPNFGFNFTTIGTWTNNQFTNIEVTEPV